MKVKVGDTVKVIAGASKGKEGKVITTLKKDNRVVIEGVNIVKKHMKPNNKNENGGIIERPNPIHVSNVKVINSIDKKVTKKEVTETKKKKSEKKEKTS